MIMSDEQFRDLINRIAGRRASWGDFDRLAQFAETLLEDNANQSKALAGMLTLTGRKDTIIEGLYVYRAADGGAGVIPRKLNYEANTREWKSGDIVIHDADEKSPKMLMIILGNSRDGQLRSQYICKGKTRRVWRNYTDSLHEPERFGLQSSWGKYERERLLIVHEQWEWVRRFNKKHPVGQLFSVGNIDGSTEELTTTGEAYLNEEGYAVVALSDTSIRTLDSLKPASQKITA